MDEDYDACRPGELVPGDPERRRAGDDPVVPSPGGHPQRYDPNADEPRSDDWGGPADTSVDAAATLDLGRLGLAHPPPAWPPTATTRPPSPTCFPDTNGRINYDVDNDGDGMTDSVWVDLGYPARRNAQGQLYKPLFAFMVIGLNGRIPLNTAGNLAGSGSGRPTPSHLGNSASEVDPTYGLQNGFNFNNDVGGRVHAPAFGGPVHGGQHPGGQRGHRRPADPASQPAGRAPDRRPDPIAARPRPARSTATTTSCSGTTGQQSDPYFLPNGIADPQATSTDIDGFGSSPPNAVLRAHPAGCRALGRGAVGAGLPDHTQSRLGHPSATWSPQLQQPRSAQGTRRTSQDVLNGMLPRRGRRQLQLVRPLSAGWRSSTGEVGRSRLPGRGRRIILPVERMRRFVTPVDINGTGSHPPVERRPRRRPGPTWAPTSGAGSNSTAISGRRACPAGSTPGSQGRPAIDLFPWTNGDDLSDHMVSNVTPVAPATSSLLNNNNPLHGFESYRFPNLELTAAASAQSPARRRRAGRPEPQHELHLPARRRCPPTTSRSNARVNSDGLNEADEMNLYQPNPQLDSPFGFGDLEWLYRQQDVDGASLTSRLASLPRSASPTAIDGHAAAAGSSRSIAGS